MCVRVCGEMFHNDNYLSVRPPGEQMGYEPANETRRKSGVCASVCDSHAYARTHAQGRSVCVFEAVVPCIQCNSVVAHLYSSTELMRAHLLKRLLGDNVFAPMTHFMEISHGCKRHTGITNINNCIFFWIVCVGFFPLCLLLRTLKVRASVNLEATKSC